MTQFYTYSIHIFNTLYIYLIDQNKKVKSLIFAIKKNCSDISSRDIDTICNHFAADFFSSQVYVLGFSMIFKITIIFFYFSIFRHFRSSLVQYMSVDSLYCFRSFK